MHTRQELHTKLYPQPSKVTRVTNPSEISLFVNRPMNRGEKNSSQKRCMSNKYFWMYPASFASREMQIKTTFKFLLILVRVAFKKHMTVNAGEEVRTYYCFFTVGESIEQWGYSKRFKTIRHRCTMLSSYTTAGYITNRLNNLLQRYLNIHIYCCCFHSSKGMELG